MVMKKIFDNIFDDEVHTSFLKFGRGEHENKYMLEGKKQASKWSIKASAEYANILVKKSLEELIDKVQIKGVIVSTLDLKDEIPFNIDKVSNFQGVKKNVINAEVNPSDILGLMEKYPKVFFALSFSGPDFILKIKPKAPASGKPGKEKEDGPSVDFCSLKTSNQEIIDELFFGTTDFKEIKITHTLMVNEMVYPENFAKLKPSEVREQSKRKGVVKRIITKDGNVEIKEANFIA